MLHMMYKNNCFKTFILLILKKNEIFYTTPYRPREKVSPRIFRSNNAAVLHFAASELNTKRAQMKEKGYGT